MERQYYNHINLLRGIAAVMVSIYHFSNYDSVHGALFDKDSMVRTSGYFGYLGVFVFFVLSGFVIPLSLQNSKFQLKRFHLFLARRYVRIEIPYVASILIVLMIGWIFSYANNLPFEFEVTRFISHLFYTVPFTGDKWYNEIYWTLGIEIQFYILIALVFYWLIKNKYTIVITIVGLLVISCLFTDHRFIFRYFPFFGAGIICWLHKQKKINVWLQGVLFSACLAASFYLFKSYEAIVIILSAVFIIWIPEMKNQHFLIGKMSYSLYLTHGAIGGNIIYFLLGKNLLEVNNIVIFCVAIIGSLIFAYIFYRLIEKPSMDLSKRIEKNKRP